MKKRVQGKEKEVGWKKRVGREEQKERGWTRG